MKQELLARLGPLGQEHLLAFWDELEDQQRSALAAQIGAIDFDELHRLYQARGGSIDWQAVAARAMPPAAFRLNHPANRFTLAQARERGQQALAAGQVGVILVAGGQGTRLGFNKPKGMFSVGPVSGASLFQILIEKMVATGRRYNVRVPLYLMTSPATHDDTLEYLAANGRFGLAIGDVHVFCQGTMPAIDAATGRVLLADKGELAVSPDGHGGMLAALAKSGGLDDIRRRGIQQLFYLQIDNPLAPICDPAFIGYHLLSSSELSTLVVAKHTPQDRVGNFVSIDGHAQVIEYSDLPAAVGEQRTADGSLTFWAGSIGIHVFEASFLARMAKEPDSFPFHIAQKKVPFIDTAGRPVDPAKPNAIKFERFIFDLVPSAKNAIAVEADESEAFKPIKNASGTAIDTRETAQEAMIALHTKWLEAAGAKVDPGVPIEISPLFALDAEQVREKLASGLRVLKPTKW